MISAALLFIGVTVVLAPEIGVYAAPIGMIVGFGTPALLMFIKGQRGNKPLFFPYREVGTAFVLAALIAGGAALLPEMSHVDRADSRDRRSAACGSSCWCRCTPSRPRTGSRSST